MSKISDALEAWRGAVRDLEATVPGAPEWHRARRVEADRRASYQTAVADIRRRQSDDSRPSQSFARDSADGAPADTHHLRDDEAALRGASSSAEG
jgi:hypothetical protein